MQRRALPVTAGLVASATLLLTACGGGDDGSKGNDKIAGAATDGTKGSASPSASVAGRPEITLPSDLTDSFDSWKTGDPAKDAVLDDVARRVDVTDYAIAQGDPSLPALSFYYSGGALADARDWVESIAKDGYSITGTDRYYDAKIDVFDSSSAGVVYCEDQSRAFAKVRRTGKVLKTDVNDGAYVICTTRLERTSKAYGRRPSSPRKGVASRARSDVRRPVRLGGTSLGCPRTHPPGNGVRELASRQGIAGQHPAERQLRGRHADLQGHLLRLRPLARQRYRRTAGRQLDPSRLLVRTTLGRRVQELRRNDVHGDDQHSRPGRLRRGSGG